MNKIKEFVQRGISSNVLKSIAIVAMLIDHVGYYFEEFLPLGIYNIFRGIGRISMPLFVYILVQGFFHTKNLKKYILRIGILAVITQVVFTVLGLICKYRLPMCAKTLYMSGNILFSFVITLLLLYVIHNKIIIKKYDFNKNMIIKIIIILSIIGIYIFVPMDYSYKVPLLGVLLYFIEKLRIMFYMTKGTSTFNFKKLLASSVNEYNFKMLYICLIFLTVFSLVLKSLLSPWTLLVVPCIALYNFEKGKDKYNIRTWYYMFFPLHHTILHSILILVSYIKLK